ncbi:two-component regulator propeller domain-containing protein [Flammeovirgaceae bacterium SG7u.111]|nr:two-component regulator propeller domain-containing protein [Flammeovirgaceae bacterium SG7u.132]WPO38615.1 two-component regulator propeller domain-containing protein [Flammeovirgaceae bacterium SG7u.111]
MKFIQAIILSLFIGTSLQVFAQSNIPVGSWRVHLTYHKGSKLTMGDNKVYCASGNSLFFLDQEDNSLNVLSKVDGLSDSQVAALGYSETLKTLVIGYQNGNIDLMNEEGIVNVRSILNSDFDDKTIHHLSINGKYGYFSTGFGVVILDLATYRIKDTYNNIGPEGAEIEVLSTTFGADSIFIAADHGLMVGSLSEDVNLKDYTNWRVVAQSANEIQHASFFDGKCYFTQENDGLYSYVSGTVSNTSIASGKMYKSLTSNAEELFLSTGEEVFLIDKSEQVDELKADDWPAPFDAFPDASGNLWVADQERGLLKVSEGVVEKYTPSGTFDPSVFKLNFFRTKVMALSGGYDEDMVPSGNFSGYYVFDEDGTWENFTSQPNFIGATPIPQTSDLVASKINFSDGLVYLASFGDGLLSWNQEDNTVSSVPNSPIVSDFQGNKFVSGMNVGNVGDLWFANYNVPEGSPSFHRLNADGTWDSFAFDATLSRFPLEVLVDDFSSVWSIVSPARGGGLFVFNEDLDKSRYLTEGSGFGNLPNGNVNAFAKDINGSIWVGTDDGVAEFFNPGGVFDSSSGDATIPRYEGRRLLEGEKVTAMEVDGGNRKWIGTLNGAWLFSDDGSELISFFDEDNSPLLSNTIIDIETNPLTGEVFFATDKGIISYRGTATSATYEHSNVKVFPNPVLPSFGGLISISGLSYNATVKITDIAGKLIWQTQAAGGTATWNGANYNGQRAQTGIYLVYSASEDGQETHVAKIAFIN